MASPDWSFPTKAAWSKPLTTKNKTPVQMLLACQREEEEGGSTNEEVIFSMAVECSAFLEDMYSERKKKKKSPLATQSGQPVNQSVSQSVRKTRAAIILAFK